MRHARHLSAEVRSRRPRGRGDGCPQLSTRGQGHFRHDLFKLSLEVRRYLPVGQIHGREARSWSTTTVRPSRDHAQPLRLDVMGHRLCRHRYRAVGGEELIERALKGRGATEGGSHGRQQHEIATHLRNTCGVVVFQGRGRRRRGRLSRTGLNSRGLRRGEELRSARRRGTLGRLFLAGAAEKAVKNAHGSSSRHGSVEVGDQSSHALTDRMGEVQKIVEGPV